MNSSLTKIGYIGLPPHVIQENNVVYIALGPNSLLCRRKLDGHYLLLAACLWESMDGEIMRTNYRTRVCYGAILTPMDEIANMFQHRIILHYCVAYKLFSMRHTKIEVRVAAPALDKLGIKLPSVSLLIFEINCSD
jgi:hypothetical protein